LISNVFVVNSVDVAGIVGNTNRGLDQLFNVHGGAVTKGADEGVLDDAVVVGRNASGLQIEGQDLLTLEKVLCHGNQSQGTPFEHHSQTT